MLAGLVKWHYQCVIVVNEHSRLGCTGPQASDHQIVSTVRSLESIVPLILNQLASVFPARPKLFRTNGPVALTAALQNDCTAKNKLLNKSFKSNFKEDGGEMHLLPVKNPGMFTWCRVQS